MADGKKISELTESASIQDVHYFPVSDGAETKKVSYSTIKNDLIDYSDQMAEVISPTITASEIEGGHRLTIEDYNGTTTVNVMDGEAGPSGPRGLPGPQGETGSFEDLTLAQIEELAGYVVDDSCIRAFDTVADMQAAVGLTAGMVCHTNGFHASGDGGAAYYAVSASGTANGMDVLALQGGLFATLVEGDVIDVMQHGATQGTTDSLAVFRYCLDKAQTANKTVMALGEYTLSGQLLFDSNNRETLIVGKLNFPSSDGLVIANQYKTVLIRDGITASGRCIYIAGNTTVSPRYIQKVTIKGYEDNKPILRSSAAPCIEVESNNRGAAYLFFKDLICGSETTSASPALYMHADTNSSFANNAYFTDCQFNLCGNDEWVVKMVGYAAWTIESGYFLNTSFEAPGASAAGALFLKNICGCQFINCRWQEHYTSGGKYYAHLEGATHDNVFDTCLSCAYEGFDLAMDNAYPFGFNYFRNARLTKLIGMTRTDMCEGFMIASDNTFHFGEPLRQRSRYFAYTGAADKIVGIESPEAYFSAYYPQVWLTNESKSITITLTTSFIRQFASFDLYYSHYYSPTASKTVTIKTDAGQILDVLNSTFTTSGEQGHIHYEFLQQYGSVSKVTKSTNIVKQFDPTS